PTRRRRPPVGPRRRGPGLRRTAGSARRARESRNRSGPERTWVSGSPRAPPRRLACLLTDEGGRNRQQPVASASPSGKAGQRGGFRRGRLDHRARYALLSPETAAFQTGAAWFAGSATPWGAARLTPWARRL